MALNKRVELYNGDVVTYHRIIELKEDMLSGNHSCKLGSFLSRVHADAGYVPAVIQEFSYVHVDGGDHQTEAYVTIMQSDGFKDAVRC